METTNINEQPHSVEFSVNAKGQWSGKVKVYNATPEGAFNKSKELAETMANMISNRNGGDSQ